MPENRLEPEYADAYQRWKAAPGLESNAVILKTLHPVIEGAARTHLGATGPSLQSRAKLLALEGLNSYDPAKGRLTTHLYNHLQGLRRYARQQGTILRAPERLLLDRTHLDRAEDELRAVLGREPSDPELADHTGFSPKRFARVRSYNAGLPEGATTSAGGPRGAVQSPAADHDAWVDLVYHDLDTYHQKVMELGLGLNGRPVLANHEIARRLGRSPGAISQAKLRIQQALDEGTELSPFS